MIKTPGASAKVLVKGLVSSFVSDLGLAAVMGAKSYFESSWEQYIQSQKPTPTGHVTGVHHEER